MSSFGDLNRVNTNIQSLDAQLSLNKINSNLADNQLRLSTGLRINRAEDDAAGFSIATKLSSRVAGLNQALQNVGDAKSVLDIAETSFDSVMDNLIEMKALTTQAANTTLGETERGYIADQIEELGADINKTSEQTVFQDLELLNGDDGTHSGNLELVFQTGERADDTITAEIEAVNVNQLFSASEAAGDLAAGTDTATSTALGLGVTTATPTSAELTGIAVEDSTGATVASATGLTIDMGAATDLSAVETQLNDLFSGNDLDNLSAEIVNDDIVVSNADTEENYTVAFSGDFDASGTASADVELTLAAGTFTENAAGQGNMDLSDWTADDYRGFMSDVDTAIETMSKRVNQVGIAQASLSMREVTLAQSISANESAASRIMDADFAKEQSESIRLQILQQTATSALAQANMGPQSVLGFLG
ncbi:MAG: flagellin [Balneolaceae bacterium]